MGKMPGGAAFLLAVLVARASLVSGQGCHVSGDCPTDGTVGGDWEDDWGCDNVNACWDEAACCNRAQGIADWCNSNNLCTTFTATGHKCCVGGGGDGTTSAPGEYDYADVLGKSILFYEAQRSGYYEGRVSWRGDSATNDFGPAGEDLVGGYYDAGDNLKLHFPFSSAFAILSWSAVSFPEAYNSAGEMGNLKSGIKWATDYMLKCHVAPDVLFAQVGDVGTDHGFWGRPEDMGGMYRPAQSISSGNPGSDLSADFAAAMASASMVFRDEDPSYAATLLEHAKQLLQFAEDHQGFYSDNIDNGGTYGSYNDKDEKGYAAAWIAKATGEAEYLEKAKSMYDSSGLDYDNAWYSWEDKTPAFVALMCENTGEDKYCNQLGTWCDNKIDGSQYSPMGEIFIDRWGSLRHAGNVASICMRAASLGINKDKYLNFVKKQIGYMLGDTGRSFVVGYGTNPPTHCHHRGASCTGPNNCCDPNCWDPNPHVLTGALVGGPGAPDDRYEDRRDDYVANEVALDYNAGFQFAIAGLVANSIG